MSRLTRTLRDLKRCASAIASNQLARHAPALYVRLTAQTGRGEADVGAATNADYFRRCFAEYLERLDLDTGATDPLAGLRLLEYGPGDVLGVALLAYAHGARQVICVDRFPLQRLSAANIAIYQALLAGLEGEVRARADTAFVRAGDAASGLNPAAIEYRVTADGCSGEQQGFDLILSRAVLEHVHDLPRLFADMRTALKPAGRALHQVDLKSHGLDCDQPLDFLTWPGWLYDLMYSHKGFPNRWRVAHYRHWVDAAGLRLDALEATQQLAAEQLAAVLPRIRPELRLGSDEELRWLGFWLALSRH